jgi:hypothetical protein
MTPAYEPVANPAFSVKSCFIVFGSTFWTIASLLSLTVNGLLIINLVYLGRQLGTIKRMVKDDLLAGLYANFFLMDQVPDSWSQAVCGKTPNPLCKSLVT